MLKGIFDSHAHYDDERFAGETDAVLRSLKGRGVERVVNIGCDRQSSRNSVLLAEQFGFVWAAVGIHPHSATELDEDALEELRRLAAHPRVVAIGEIGLDYHYDFSPREIQIQAFERQLTLANELDLPVVIHTREATEPTLELLRRYRPRGVVHCFTGSREVAQEILSLGMYLGSTGAVTFKGAKRVVGSVEATPLDRLLLETDCPYMAPVPYRGQRCESWMIAQTAQKIAEIKGMQPQDVIDRAYRNTCELFQIPDQID